MVPREEDVVGGIKLRRKKMSIVNMKKLLEAGVHFGHQTRRWNPKMADYIFTERNGIYIIDLQQTVGLVDKAYNYIKEVVANGQDILFVGTKKQAQESIEKEAKRCGMHFVSQRWLGGMLTNYKTIKKRIDRLHELEEMEESGKFELLPKKEVIQLKHEADRLEKFLGGIKNMKNLPGAMFIEDPKKEENAVKEAKIMGIPVVSIIDTNCDPDEIDVVIPGNDDAIRAIKLFTSVIADAVLEAKQGVQLEAEEAEKEKVQSQEANNEVKKEDKTEAKIKETKDKE